MRKCVLLFLCCLLLQFIPVHLVYAATPLKVGVYDNKPLAFTDSNGDVKGFLIDILEYIGLEEGWQIEYVPGYWVECLERLQAGKIDVLVGVEYSRERNKVYDFTYENTLSDWGIVYTQKGSNINQIVNLDNKKIAVVHGDIHYNNLRNLAKQFKLNIRFVEVYEYDGVLELIDQERVDAGVVNRLYGLEFESYYNVNRSSIIFSPSEVHFAVPKKKHRQLINGIDKYLGSLKSDKGSIYHQSLQRWTPLSNKWVLPKWLIGLLAVGSGLLLLFFTTGLILRAQVKAKTAELSLANQELLAEIAERKRVEEALRLTQFSVDHAGDAVFWMGPDARFIYVNDAACRSLGYTREELLSMSVHDIDLNFPKEIWPKHWEEIIRRRTFIIESQHRAKDGRVFPVEITVNYLDFEGKEYNCAFARDITERKLAEEALRESEERYRTVLEANPDPVVVYDIEGKVVYFNPAFTDVFGWTLEERLGKKLDGFVPEAKRPETKMMIDKVLAGESFSTIESFRYTKDGDIIPVSISGAVHRDGEGNLVGSVINLRDVTERKKLESQLQQAQKMEAVGTLAGGVAHDFNNLLQAVQGYAELALMGKRKDEPGYREVQEIVRAARRGGELTQQLLAFSRKAESNLRPTDLNHEVKNIKRLLERTIPKMIDIELDLQENLKAVNADPAQIEQILMNLAVNAKDAMSEEGKLTIATRKVTLDETYCRTHTDAKPGEYVMLSITDTGYGIARETMDRIFEPFYTTKGVGEGTGLGLAMVYGIVKNHGGYVMCSSEPGAGATFEIYLPAIEKMVEPIDDEVIEPQQGGGETILLVDDEDFIRELGKEMLERFGYNLVTATNGEGALEIYRQRNGEIDLVILDLIMPGIGGKRCLEELLEIDPQVRVVIASGYSFNVLTREAPKAGVSGFINKPYDMRQMLKVVRGVLDKE
ncbi:MAG: PAS domain S-box protein [Deltaproteobacteria bacterium]|nr:MAG: PAS domain S-box protein [Deltaproteobacteria bacterium]